MGTDLYRLRSGGRIVGYRKQVGRYAFFSRDDFWYNGTVLDFDTEEAFTGVKDRRGQKLFVGDVVRCTVDGQEKTIRIRDMGNGIPGLCCHVTELELAVADSNKLLSDGHFVSQAR